MLSDVFILPTSVLRSPISPIIAKNLVIRRDADLILCMYYLFSNIHSSLHTQLLKNLEYKGSIPRKNRRGMQSELHRTAPHRTVPYREPFLSHMFRVQASSAIGPIPLPLEQRAPTGFAFLLPPSYPSSAGACLGDLPGSSTQEQSCLACRNMEP